MFSSNPLGIQAGGVTIEGQGDDLSFDALWQAAGRVTEFGYIVALRRRMAEKNEDTYWPGITDRIAGFSSQFAEASGLGVLPGEAAVLSRERELLSDADHVVLLPPGP